MTPAPREILLDSPDETARFARRLGACLRPGDCLLLDGQIGAGKTHFARSLIQSLQSAPEDVPSPTYTLVQTYETPAGELWHADLYRLSDPAEIVELGLWEAFDTAISLVEWPGNLGPDAPDHALHLGFEPMPGSDMARRLNIRWSDPKWTRKLEHATRD